MKRKAVVCLTLLLSSAVISRTFPMLKTVISERKGSVGSLDDTSSHCYTVDPHKRAWQLLHAGNFTQFKNWVQAKKININLLDEHGNTFLIWAVWYNNDALVTWLLERGADREWHNDEGITVRDIAAFQQLISDFQQLIEDCDKIKAKILSLIPQSQKVR